MSRQPFDFALNLREGCRQPIVVIPQARREAVTHLMEQHALSVTLAFTRIGGTLAGTVLTLMFLPAMYSIWFKIKPMYRPG